MCFLHYIQSIALYLIDLIEEIDICYICVGAEYGAVTALGINTNSTRLLCGHAKGQVMPNIRLSVCLTVYVHLSVCLFVCLFDCLSVCLFV